MAASITIDEAGIPRRADGQVLRGCDVCVQVDYHPRHVLGVPPETPGAVPSREVVAGLIRAANEAGATPEQVAFIVAEQADDTTVVRHLDCCRDHGCYDGSCAAKLAEVGDVRHEELVGALHEQNAALDAGRED